jgi:hypothetical protein
MRIMCVLRNKQGNAFLLKALGVCVIRSLVVCVCFVDRCLFFWTVSFDHFLVCSSSIYGFWLEFNCTSLIDDILVTAMNNNVVMQIY